MKRENKQEIVELLSQTLKEKQNFYLTDISELDANATNELRKECYDKGIRLQVVKNTLIRKALEASELNSEDLDAILAGPSALMFSEAVNEPAKLIKKFRETHDKPLLKGAYIEEALYVGDDKIEVLSKLKSKNELIAEVVALLKSPAQNVISGLQSGGNKIAGIVKALAEKSE